MIRPAGILAVLALAGCAGSETGNPVIPTTVGLSARSSAPEAVVVGPASSTSATNAIEEAWFALGEFFFVHGADCDQLSELSPDVPTLVVADLARPNVRVTADVEPGRFCGLIVPLQLGVQNLPAQAPTALRDHSIAVRGKRADGTPFVLVHPEDDDLDLAADGGEFEVRRGGPRLLLSFDVAAWTKDVAFDDAVIDSEGVIRIDETMNRRLADTFEENLECSFELYSDEDDDGTVSDGDLRLASCAED
jgi:hypothetical protein